MRWVTFSDILVMSPPSNPTRFRRCPLPPSSLSRWYLVPKGHAGIVCHARPWYNSPRQVSAANYHIVSCRSPFSSRASATLSSRSPLIHTCSSSCAQLREAVNFEVRMRLRITFAILWPRAGRQRSTTRYNQRTTQSGEDAEMDLSTTLEKFTVSI